MQSGSSTGEKKANIKKDKSIKTKGNKRKNKLLSNKNEFFILINSFFIFGKYIFFLNLNQKTNEIKKFKIEKIIIFFSLKQENKDRISEFKIIKEKKIIKNIDKDEKIEQIKYVDIKFSAIVKNNTLINFLYTFIF